MEAPPTQPDQPGIDPSVVFASMRRGFRRVCPKCGEGRLFEGVITSYSIHYTKLYDG